MSIPMTEQVACVQREIRMRERTYPRWVAAGRMTQRKANEETEAMKAVLDTLKALEPGERLI